MTKFLIAITLVLSLLVSFGAVTTHAKGKSDSCPTGAMCAPYPGN